MRLRKVSHIILLISTFTGIWYFLTDIYGINEIFLPTPVKTFKALFNLLIQSDFWVDLGYSWYRVLLGFVISFCIAYPIVLLSLWNSTLRDTLFYIVEFFRYLPVPVFIPITILWFGIEDMSKIVIIVLGTFAQMVPMFYDSAAIIEKKYASFNYALKWSTWDYIKSIIIKGSAPGILDSSRICIGWAWTYLIVAEIAGAEHGIGYALIRSQRYLATDKIFSYIITIGLIGILTDRTLAYLRLKIYPWYK